MAAPADTSDADAPAAAAAASALGFTANALDRADHLRKDPARLDALAAAADARVAPFWRAKPFVIERRGAAEPGFLAASALSALNAETVIFLGLENGAGVFAAALPSEREPGPEFPLHGLGAFADLRAVAPRLEARDAAILGAGRSLLSWHHKHEFCANCGARTAPADGGWRRSCSDCGSDHFPRVDPVVIMAIARGDQLLLGRQPGWPQGFWSCLAGFVEPGETIEQACRREALEEAGVTVGAVRYVASQPWPFPSSLMVGLIAQTDTEELTIDARELEAARWVSRDEARAIIAGAHPEIRSPPPLAIAHHLTRLWSEAGG